MSKSKKIDEFIAKYPQKVQIILNKLRTIIGNESPEIEETIAYGIPTFRMNGKNLVHFSAFKHHIGFYPTPSGIETFKKELSTYKSAKGSVQFLINEPIPYELIKKIVKFRVSECLSKNKTDKE
ncbi:MAG: DUF1801 domain-containing protein [Microgenomates group bacterium]